MGRGAYAPRPLDGKAAPSQHRVMMDFAPLAPDRCSRSDPKYLKAAVDWRLRGLLPVAKGSDDLVSALHYSLLAPGKRIRPVLTVLAAWELGGQDLTALDAGCALEMVHTASLILDDLPSMDDAAMRRGQPATHVRFGEDVAMLAAITLLSLAYGTVGNMTHVPSDVRCALVGILARAVGPDGLAGGQFADLRPSLGGGVREAMEANHRKTGALFLAAAEIAAAIHGGQQSEAEPLHRCVCELGQAYQIFDDLIDSAGLDRMGRPEDGARTTLLSLIGADAARLRLQNHVDVALAGLRPSSPLADYVRTLFSQVSLEPELA